MTSKKPGFVGKAFRRVSRYSEILGVLFRFGFTDMVRRVDSDTYRRLRGGGAIRESRKARRHWTRPERFRMALEELGPTFVKIGQLLSHRPDLFDVSWIEELEKLRASVAPLPFEDITQVLIQELGGSLEGHFVFVDREPLASASIAQVHRARLADGSEVVLKVQRPGIRRLIESDMAILRDLARIADRRVPAVAAFQPVEAVKELERSLKAELDFHNEADNLDQFRRNFDGDVTVTAPKPFRDLSSDRVLTMSFLEGAPIGDEEALERLGVDQRRLARRGSTAVLKQIFEHRFFHSDPHGHNVMALRGDVVAFLDFGQIGTILPSQRLFLADLLTALVRADSRRAVRAILGWSGYREPEETRRLTDDIEHLIEHHLTRPFGRMDIGEMVSAFLAIIRRYRIEIPVNFYMLAKALSTIEDIARSLDPEFDLVRAASPFARRMVRRELSPDRLMEHATGIAGDAFRLVRDLPGEARDILNLLKAGKLRMEFELKDLDKMNHTLSRVVTRLSAAVLLASMILGSSLLVQSGIPPLVYGMPVIGILGFLFSGIVGVFLLFDLWRHR